MIFLLIKISIILILVCPLNKLNPFLNKLLKEYRIFINRILFMEISNLVIFLSIKKIKLKYVILGFLLKEKINKKLMKLKELLHILHLNASFLMIKKLIFGLSEFFYIFYQLELSLFISKSLNNWHKFYLNKN